MTREEALAQLESLGSPKMREFNTKHGVGQQQYGVRMGDIRALAKKIKADHHLALELWATGNIDARFLAILIMDPKKLNPEELTRMVASERFTHVADWLYSYVVKDFTDNESLREGWMNAENVMLARAGWSLTSGCVARNPDRLDIPALLSRIESDMAVAAPEVQWTMNATLANIGIHFEEYRSRALEIGERLGIYRNYPVSKGCTSPFAPVWISEMVRRKNLATP